ncbi:TraR/DksA C4-type zinc finger protein [Microbacterium sp. STN6]|uniref:TraR/DksA family transcriptional regulator n=1 Tax=Microbacterium sp. STN6 TaxID=2995588 RepID=UPI0022609A91|nr:TraR/DksA C4-type zinc finger protein [Microbacterium sp. STN6]MCX7523446.1 TraR/DksA C4-type zinc finger protein [Microbacterium sp. STN6]
MEEPERERFRALLTARRREAVGKRAELEEAMRRIRSERSSASADDEHDPEGPTMSFEWSRVAGLQADAAAEIPALDAALARIDAGTYGVCARCGGPIAPERLQARPTAELCITCARDAR